MSRKPKAAQSARDKFDFLHAAIADADLSAAAKVVLVPLVLKYRNSKTGRCNPSMATIGKAMSRDRRNVITAVAELRTRGWLKIVTTKGGSKLNTNKYTFDFKQRAPVMQTSPVMKSSPVMKTVPTSDVNAPRILEEPPALSARGCVGACQQRPRLTARRWKRRTARRWWCLKARRWQRALSSSRRSGARRSPMAWTSLGVESLWRICEEHTADEVLASAERWLAITSTRYTKRLEIWLSNGAWQNDPADRRAEATGRRGKDDPVEAMMRAGGWEPMQ